MKASLRQILDELSALDPTTTHLVKSIRVYLRSGRSFTADDVTVTDNQERVFLRNVNDADETAVILAEEIVGYEAIIDRDVCSDFKVNPSLPDVISYSMKR